MNDQKQSADQHPPLEQQPMPMPPHIAALNEAVQRFQKAQVAGMRASGNVDVAGMVILLNLLQIQFDVVVTQLIEAKTLDHQKFVEVSTMRLNAISATMERPRIMVPGIAPGMGN